MEKCRLERFREANGIQAETVASLCGISVESLLDYEAGGYVPHEDRVAFRVLFGETVGVGELMTTIVAPNEEKILERLKLDYTRTLARWRAA